MGNGIAEREVGQGIACPGDQLCKILGMRQPGVFIMKGGVWKARREVAGGDEAGGRPSRSTCAGSTACVLCGHGEPLETVGQGRGGGRSGF